MKIKFSLHLNPDLNPDLNPKTNARFAAQKLENEMFKSRFSVERRNRFAVLEVKENIIEDCIEMEKVYTKTVEKVLSRAKKKNKKSGGNLESNRRMTDVP